LHTCAMAGTWRDSYGWFSKGCFKCMFQPI